MTSVKPLQLTLAIMKPHVVSCPFSLHISKTFHASRLMTTVTDQPIPTLLVCQMGGGYFNLDASWSGHGLLLLWAKDIRRTILENGFYVIRSKRQTIKLEQAEQFYSEHKTKFFYNRLITFMTSGPSEAYILAREDAISIWRHLMGPTKVFQCQLSNPDSIRAKHGLTDTRNATHGSDSDESVRQEIRIMVPQFCFENWKQTEEPMFRNGKVHFNDQQFIHFARKS